MIEGVKDIKMEYPIDVEELNVKGFIDMVIFMEDGSIYVYDFKTIGSWSWKFKFGRKYKDPNPSFHQETQLGTYGYAIKKEFGRCDGLYLLYYNKDNSQYKECEVDLEFIDRAYNYWNEVKDSHEQGLPMLQEGVAPVQEWECRYCNYKDLCEERG